MSCGDCGFTIEARPTGPDRYRAELEDATVCDRLVYWRHVQRLESLEATASDRWLRALTSFARRWRRAFDEAHSSGAALGLACEAARRTLAVADIGPLLATSEERMPPHWRTHLRELAETLHGFAPAWWRDRPLERTLMVGTGVTVTLPATDVKGRPIAAEFRALPLILDRIAVLRELGTVIDTVVVEEPDVPFRLWRHDGYMKALTLAGRLLAATMGLVDGARAITPEELAGVRVTTFAPLPNGQIAFTNEETVAYSEAELHDWLTETMLERAEWTTRLGQRGGRHAWPRAALASGPCGGCEFEALCAQPETPAVRALYAVRGDEYP